MLKKVSSTRHATLAKCAADESSHAILADPVRTLPACERFWPSAGSGLTNSLSCTWNGNDRTPDGNVGYLALIESKIIGIRIAKNPSKQTPHKKRWF